MSKVNLYLMKEEIQLDVLSEEQFSLEDSISEANHILQDLNKEGFLIDGDFDSQTWTFRNHLTDGHYIYIRFKPLTEIVRFNKKINISELELMIKCWTANLLTEMYPASATLNFKHLMNAINHTVAFSDEFVESLATLIINDSISDNTKAIIINAILNFLDYSELDINNKYISTLVKLKSKLKVETNVRVLPPSKDILTFSSSLEKYFQGIDSANEKLLYYPILLWWELSIIIPMRPSEFCLIERNCLSDQNGTYLITLPRKKQKFSKRRVQIMDTIRITAEIYNLIQDYMTLTDSFGHTDTLISYRVFFEILPSYQTQLNRNKFNRNALSYLLQHFYQNIVFGKLGEIVTQQIRPNDTRHLAFCSLRLQGISPVEIARLGGHSTIEAQYHYTMHPEYYIDLRIKTLLEKYKLRVGEEKEKQKLNINNGGILPGYLINKSLNYPTSSFRVPLREAGYCTDEQQKCQSKECIFCDHWWISPQELAQKQDFILEKINKARTNIFELAAFIINLHKKLKLDDESAFNPFNLNLLHTKAQELDGLMHQMSRLELLRGTI